MRIRTVKPSFWESEAMSSVSAEAALLAIGLENLADDEGYFKANPKLIEAKIFPLRELSSNIRRLLDELLEIGYIEIRNDPEARRSWGLVVKFKAHQKVDRARPSEIRELFELAESSGKARRSLDEGSSLEGKGKEGKGNDPGSGDPGSRKPEGPVYRTKKGRKLTGDQLTWFEQFWKLFGKKDGKAEAADAWLDVGVSSDLLEDVLYGAEAERRSRNEIVSRGGTPKWAQGWLSGRRWEKYVEERDVAASSQSVPLRERSLNALKPQELDELCAELGIERQQPGEGWPEFSARIEETRRAA